MRSVSLVGVGMTPFGKHADQSLSDIALPAVVQALGDSAIKKQAVEAAYCGSMYSGTAIGQRILKEVGLTGIPISNVENACSSSATALHLAWVDVASGEHDIVLVLGVEKLTALGGGPLPLAADDIEVAQGMVMPALYAMRAQRHMLEYGTTLDQLAMVSVKNRLHGSLNPHAQFRTPVSVDEVHASRPVADPLTLFHCCPSGDGAAAVVVAPTELAHRLGRKPVRILSSVLTSGRVMQGGRDMASPEVTVRAAKQAYEQAGVGPEDIDVAEVHDAFTIAELLYYEALGFCEVGQSGKLIEAGATRLGGRLPVNTSGGLLAKGHPVGATGIAQVAEIVWQLRGEAGARQVPNARVGLTHCTGGGVSGLDHAACSIHVLAA
jgi:acetyl-CoA acetyltransferase